MAEIRAGVEALKQYNVLMRNRFPQIDEVKGKYSELSVEEKRRNIQKDLQSLKSKLENKEVVSYPPVELRKDIPCRGTKNVSFYPGKLSRYSNLCTLQHCGIYLSHDRSFIPL